MACYRSANMLMHAAVAATDAARARSAGQIGAAVTSLFRRSVAQSLWALMEETPLGSPGKRAAANNEVPHDGLPKRTEA